jgi:hypothetical protein
MSNEPFAVYTTEGVLRSTHGTVESAAAAAGDANAEAMRLGIKARYEHGPNRAARAA